MKDQRWLRIIPVALIMYTISYVDRTNISLALDPKISSMMRELAMDDRMKGEAAGIFFLGYILLQMPGGYWATRFGARRVISFFLVAWGACAVACGFSASFRGFEVCRFLLGVAESGVFPATMVLLTSWFPRGERARASALWNLCQPLAVAGTAPLTGWLLGAFGWKSMMMIEGALPFIWLPIWWFGIRDHPAEAKWISNRERTYLETTLEQEAVADSRPALACFGALCRTRTPYVMVAIYFLHNCAAYGCMTFFTAGLKGRGFNAVQSGFLLSAPYLVTAIAMVILSWLSDRNKERRAHVSAAYAISGVSLILSVALADHFWLSYALLCLAIPGPFAAMAPFWAIPCETLPRVLIGVVIGVVNAIGNVGGFAGQYIVGWLKNEYHSTAIPFSVLGIGMLIAAGLAFLLPKSEAPGSGDADRTMAATLSQPSPA
jgi:MFS family permease